ncbi:hypothetical protein [Oceanirhabdus sp. W0125-5]|uniref:hypothetical protein n=1 Tax=Oceanirhabdus sp. W0125-5 TaxID=2999116 RepID=UPI0022F3325D|nr:hypothetical protein [Oceanirhabdus sp. W0125-5]WBW99000.1 hypothetical protein OW730_09710 [Oceanirhabdus sp. W0125-5]
MFKSKMDLRIKLLSLPFTEFEFYKEDKFEILARLGPKIYNNDDENYTDKFEKEILPEIYKILHRNQRILELDQVELLIKKYYPENEIRRGYSEHENMMYVYLKRLCKLSSYLLTHRDGKISLKYWEAEEEKNFLGPYKGIYKIAFWNSMNRMITTDILVMVYLINNNMLEEEYLKIFPSFVTLEDVQLEQIYRKGLGETHLHMNAGIDFQVSWIELMSLDRNKKEQNMLLLEQDKVIGKNFDINIYVKVMAVVRILLSYYLRCYSENIAVETQNSMFEFYNRMCIFEKGKEQSLSARIMKLLTEVCNGNEISKNYESEIVDIYEELKFELNIYENMETSFLKWNEILCKRDVIHKVLSSKENLTDYTIENLFMFKSIKYIMAEPKDVFFSRIFSKYIIIKNEVFQLKVQGNLIKGLKYFSDYYDRSTNNVMDRKEHIGLILHNQIKNNHLKKLELRCTVKGNPQNIYSLRNNTKDFLRDFFEVYLEILKDMENQSEDMHEPLIGLVFHFIKSRDPFIYEKCWLNYKNSDENYFLNFKEHQCCYENQIEVINELREKIVNLDKYIIGIDSASIENNTDPWVFTSVYKKARMSSERIPINIKNNKVINNLGFTFHAGEDFRHIITGIRRVDEVIEHFKFHAGDRIGHGIALGIYGEKWVENNRIIIIPRIEHLENMLWIWGIHKDNDYLTEMDMGYLERKILECAEKIYIRMEGITVYNLWKAYRKKFNGEKIIEKFSEKVEEQKLNDIFCPYAHENKTLSNLEYSYRRDMWDEDKLLLSHHCKCYLEKMNEPIEIEVKKEEIPIIKNLQKIVLSKISQEGIVIETNPTSNIAIGQIDSILEHYIFNLNQRGLKKDIKKENGIIVTINSDDPSVFNTNISSELSYIFYSLIEKGYAREDVLFWIDRIRENGIRTSFIKEDEYDIHSKIKEIEEIIRSLRE